MTIAQKLSALFPTFVPPIGMVSPFAGVTAPAGWILCDGRNVNRTTYTALLAVISTTFGAGDGSTTFGIPDLRGRAVYGRDPSEATARITAAVSGLGAGTLGAVGGSQYLHAHNHGVNDPTHNHTLNDPTHAHTYNAAYGQAVGGNGEQNAAVTVWDTVTGNYSGTYNSGNYTGISIQNNGAGGSQNVPPAIVLNYIIFAGV